MAITISPKGRVAVLSDEQALEDALNNDLVLPSLFKISAKGGKFNVFGINGKITSAEADDAINRWTTPTPAMEDALAVFVNAEVANGNWGTNASNYTDSLYDFFILAAGVNSDVNSLTDVHQVIKLLATNNGASRTSGGWSYSAATHFTDMNYDPSTDGVNYALDDAMVGGFVKTNGSSGTEGNIIRALGTSRATMNSQIVNNRIQWSLNDVTTNSKATTDIVDDSMAVIERTTSTALDLLVDGVSIDSSTTTSTVILDTNILFGGDGTNGFSGGVIASFMAGAAVGFDQSGHNTNIRTMLTSLGVLP